MKHQKLIDGVKCCAKTKAELTFDPLGQSILLPVMHHTYVMFNLLQIWNRLLKDQRHRREQLNGWLLTAWDWSYRLLDSGLKSYETKKLPAKTGLSPGRNNGTMLGELTDIDLTVRFGLPNFSGLPPVSSLLVYTDYSFNQLEWSLYKDC